MNGKVLVAYGTRNGATAEIAEKIGATLRQAGLGVDVLPAENVSGLEGYGAAVIGSAVYVGSWRKEAADLLTSRQAELAGLPVWLFSSGPTGSGDPSQIMNGFRFPEALQPVAGRIRPRDIALFHGVLEPRRLNLLEKIMIQTMKAPLGDFRDWQAIEQWAGGIAAALA